MIRFIEYLLLLLIAINVYSGEIFLNRPGLNDICKSIKILNGKKKDLEKLNAYDRAEEKLKIDNEIKKMTRGYFILKVSSSEFSLKDYNFKNDYFEIGQIKLKTGLKIITDIPVYLNISKEKAKMVAAKKKLGILDLYLKIKLKNSDNFYENYCLNRKKAIISPEIKEYFFMCSKSDEIIDYEIVGNKEHFVDNPFIDEVNPENRARVLKEFRLLENKFFLCRLKNKGYGIKIYEIKVFKDGDKVLINRSSEIKNKELERCVDKKVMEAMFPVQEQDYKIYFSVVFSNME